MRIASPKFNPNQPIPARYTCDGENISPPLEFADVPVAAKSLAVIMDDPDAPNGDFVHWLLWNIPARTLSIAENSVPEGAEQGKNDFGRNRYGGPCPPTGTHRYFFKLYALAIQLDLPADTEKKILAARIKNHLLAQAELVGVYRRPV